MAIIMGTPDSDNLVGTAQADLISGYEGNDLIIGLEGNDSSTGGDGADRFVYRNLSDLTLWTGNLNKPHEVIVDFGHLGAIAGPGADILDFSGLDAFTFLGDSGFSGTGRSEYRFERSGDGATMFFDEDGNGNADHYLVINDLTVEASFEGDPPINPVASNMIIAPDFTFHYVVGLDSDDILIGSTLGERLYGLAGNDTLLAGNGADELFGGVGKDLLNGGEGADTMRGGDGNDVYYVNSEFDQSIEEEGSGIDLVNSSADYFALGEHVENASLFGSGRTLAGNTLNNIVNGNGITNVLYGGAGNDALSGGGGRDGIYGGQGNDWIRGGTGSDLIQGNLGADKFVYFSAVEIGTPGTLGQDVIVDFTGSGSGVSRETADRIDLHRIDANTHTAQNDAFTFIGAAAFSGAAGELRYFLGSATFDDPDPTSGRTPFQAPAIQIEGDLDGDGVADFQLALLSVSQINADDFYL